MKLLSTFRTCRLTALVLTVLGLFSAAAPPGMAQQSDTPLLAQIGKVNSQEPDPAVVKLEKEAEKQRNLKRQQEIRQDSEKLLELATELKQSVDKTNENVISLDVIKKAEQIEKLAKNVKEKMKQ
jgi:hypothetical protein